MSRKIQIARNILIIVIVIGLYLLVQLWAGAFLSKEALFEHWERSMHYGPAEKILLDYETDDNKAVIFAKYENGIGILGCERKGILWNVAKGPSDILTCDSKRFKNGEGGFATIINAAYGWTPVEGTEEVLFYMGEHWIDDKPVIGTAEVEKNGFFFKAFDRSRSTYSGSGSVTYLQYLAGFDKDGNIIWQSGGSNNISDWGVFRASYHEFTVEEEKNLPEIRFDAYRRKIELNYKETSEYDDATGTFEFGEGCIMYGNHRFNILYNDALMYEGNMEGGPELEGVKPGNVFVLD